MERFADGLSATVFRGRMQPVDLANRLVRQADLLVTESPIGPEIPNFFDIAVSTGDMAPDMDMAPLEEELKHTLAMTAAGRGWRTGGPIGVRLRVDKSVGRGSIRCVATPLPAEMPAWGELAEHRGARRFPLADNRVVVGRSTDADVTLEEAEVSRLHAVLFREGGGLWVTDLGSANGTSVNGQPVAGKPFEVGPGDMLSFGPTTFALRTG